MRPIEGNLVEEAISDPRWFPLRFDPKTEVFHFAFIPADVHRGLAFLRDFRPAASEIRLVPRSAVTGIESVNGPVHLILHSGLGGSTLVARTLSQPGVAVPLLEPPILTDVIGYGKTSSSGERGRLLGEVTALMARRWSTGEAVICKLSGVGNGLALAMAAAQPQSRLLCLENPLDQLLASFAARGIGGRMAGRQLLIGLRNSGMFAFEMTDKQLLDHTDFQMAALAWLSIQKIMAAAAEGVGLERAASLTSGQLMKDTAGSLSAIASHFALDLDIDACIDAGVLDRHAKGGEPFDSGRRAERIAEALDKHRGEIEPVVSWARSIAQKTKIPWELPHRLAKVIA